MSLKNTLKKMNPLASNGVSPVPADGYIFPSTNPDIDGEDCLHDCETCTTHYPKRFAVDGTDKLYGEVNGWSRHLIVATGKADWVRDVADEKGSVMEAVGRWKDEVERAPKHTGLRLSASNIPLPDHEGYHHHEGTSTKESVNEQRETGTTCLLLPAFTVLEHVTPQSVPKLLASEYFQQSTTNKSILGPYTKLPIESLPDGVTAKECPHDYLILLCSQKTRDARCGQSAPLLRREFERHLRPLGLYRDLDDDRPGGVGIYFVSHTGGHKYSANVLIYRSQKVEGETAGKEAAQCIWIARVRPEDCENIVRYTVLEGKVVKPARQLRGGFDRTTGKVSW